MIAPPLLQPPHPSSTAPQIHGEVYDNKNVSEEVEEKEEENNDNVEESAAPDIIKPIVLNSPQASLYVSNIDWSIKKSQVKRSLYTLFSRHGRVLDVIILRGYGLAGQAFVLFDSVDTATQALQAEQGFIFFDRPLQINYTKEKSDRTAKRDGTYTPMDRSEKRLKRHQQFELSQRMKQMEKDEEESEEGVDESTTTAGIVAPPPSSLEGIVLPQQQLLVTPAGIPVGAAVAHPPARSSNILFADKLPLNCNELMLSMLFRQYPGFQEVRIPRPGMAFIEYQLPTQAESAMQALQGCKLTESDTLVLQFSIPQTTTT